MSVIARLDRSRACPTSALNCRNRKHPISMRSSNPGAAYEAPYQSWWLLDAPLEAGHDTHFDSLILRTLLRFAHPTYSRSQREHVQHGGRRHVLDLRGQSVDVDVLARACKHRHILLSVHRIGDGRRVDAGADIEAPYLLQGLCIIRPERAVGLAEEYQISGSGERAAVVGIIHLQRRLGLAGNGIDRLQAAV